MSSTSFYWGVPVLTRSYVAVCGKWYVVGSGKLRARIRSLRNARGLALGTCASINKRRRHAKKWGKG